MYNVPAVLFLYQVLTEEKINVDKKVNLLTPENVQNINDSFLSFYSEHGLKCSIFKDEYFDYFVANVRSGLKINFQESKELGPFLHLFVDAFFKHDKYYLKKKNIDFFKDFGLPYLHESYGMIITKSIYYLFHKKQDFPLPFEQEHFYKKMLNCTYLNEMEMDFSKYTSNSRLSNTLLVSVASLIHNIFKCSNVEADARAKVIVSECLRKWDYSNTKELSPKIFLYFLVDAIVMQFIKVLNGNPLDPSADNVASGLAPLTHLFGQDAASTQKKTHQQLDRLTSKPNIEFMRLVENEELDPENPQTVALLKSLMGGVHKDEDDEKVKGLISFFAEMTKELKPLRQMLIKTGHNPELLFWEKLPENSHLFLSCCHQLVELSGLDQASKNPFEVYIKKTA